MEDYSGPASDPKDRADPDADELDDLAAGCYFPRGYVAGLVEFLGRHRDRLRIVTYDGLLWGDDYDAVGCYPEERRRWQARAKELRAAGVAEVLLQHDVDSRPERTFALLDIEQDHGVPSTLMVFHRRVDRRHMIATGELQYTPYPLDVTRLVELSQRGWRVGYHTNAMERTGWDQDAAARVFLDDLNALRAWFDVRYFSPHGGVRGPDGANNHTLDPPDQAALDVRWVHNGKSPSFTATFSDGGINAAKLDASARDIRRFVEAWQPGGRYRLLIHPQYYGDHYLPAPRLSGAPWYDAVLADPDADHWADVQLPW